MIDSAGSLPSPGRLRKIKCIYRPNNPAVCINCFSRGVHCGSQEAAQIIIQSQDSRLNLKERVARLEHLIGSMLSGQVRPEDVSRPNLQLPREPQSTSHPTQIEPARPGGELQDAPENILAFSLFENNILAHDETASLPQYIHKEFNSQFLIPRGDDDTVHSRTSRRKRSKLCETLTSLLPTETAMHAILNSGGIWWAIARKIYPYICTEDETMTLPSYVLMALNQDNPVVIGCALCWISLSIQHLPTDFESSDLSLPLPLSDLMELYVKTVDKLIVADEELSMSLEGIESILLLSQFYGSVGRPRKAWTTIRRGISHAVLLGLHEPPRFSSGPHSTSAIRRDSVWWHLAECESALCLMLGLPTSMTISSKNIEDESNGLTNIASSGVFRRKLALIARTVSQRSQKALSDSQPSTQDIDQELDHLANIMATHWWHDATPKHNIPDIIENHERIVSQFSYHQVKVYLHLPFFLQPPNEAQHDGSRIQCLNASRNMIVMYIKMREQAAGKVKLCRVIDFQAFTAAIVLVLGQLGYSPAGPEEAREGKDDQYLLQQTIEILRRVSLEYGNLTAAQSHQALTTLVELDREGLEGQTCKVFVPYFGMISVMVPARSVLVQDGKQQNTNIEMMCEEVQAEQLDMIFLEQPPRWSANTLVNIELSSSPFMDDFIGAENAVTFSGMEDGSSLSNFLATDIDQDWSWLCNENGGRQV
jgi:hypothetical protein